MKNREYAEQLQEKQAEMEECRREMEALGSKKVRSARAGRRAVACARPHAGLPQSSVPELQARRANYNSDLAKFKTLIRQLQDQQGKLQQRVEEKQQEVKRRGACRARAAASAATLVPHSARRRREGAGNAVRAKAGAAGAAGCAGAERRRRAAHGAGAQVRKRSKAAACAPAAAHTRWRRHLQDTLQNAAAQKDKAQSAVWSLEMRLGSVLTQVRAARAGRPQCVSSLQSRRWLQLEEAVREYNNKALSLQLIPATAKYARSQDFELAVLASTPAAFDANGGGLLSQDVRTGIKVRLPT